MTRRMIFDRIARLRRDLGAAGVAAFALFAGAALLYALAVQPMQAQNETLDASLARIARQAQPRQALNSADKLAAFYGYLKKDEEVPDWLAKLYAIGKATGIELQSANYTTQKDGGRLERYEITLPVTGSYGQIRDFMKRALAEIPVLSLDQVTLKRENRNDGAVRAELKLTLHRLKS